MYLLSDEEQLMQCIDDLCKMSTLKKEDLVVGKDVWIAKQIVEYYHEKEKSEIKEGAWPLDFGIFHISNGPTPICMVRDLGERPAVYVYYDSKRYHGIRSLNVTYKN